MVNTLVLGSVAQGNAPKGVVLGSVAQGNPPKMVVLGQVAQEQAQVANYAASLAGANVVQSPVGSSGIPIKTIAIVVFAIVFLYYGYKYLTERGGGKR